MDDFNLTLADPALIDDVLPLVAAYHAFEQVPSSADFRRKAVASLLENRDLGEVWLIRRSGRSIGYIAVCFGYSIEFAGRDAFIDEFFIEPDERGKGIGSSVLKKVAAALRDRDIAALHLEVARTNARAKSLYAGSGFTSREKYHLMSLTLSR